MSGRVFYSLAFFAIRTDPKSANNKFLLDPIWGMGEWHLSQLPAKFQMVTLNVVFMTNFQVTHHLNDNVDRFSLNEWFLYFQHFAKILKWECSLRLTTILKVCTFKTWPEQSISPLFACQERIASRLCSNEIQWRQMWWRVLFLSLSPPKGNH